MLHGKHATAARQAEQLFAEGILSQAELERELAFIASQASQEEEAVAAAGSREGRPGAPGGQGRGRGRQDVSKRHAVPCPAPPQMLLAGTHHQALPAALLGAMTAHREFAGAQQLPAAELPQRARATMAQQSYYESLGYRCPHCQRDFSQTNEHARNGAMSRHMKKCAEKAGFLTRGASCRGAGLAGRCALRPPAAAHHGLGGSGEGGASGQGAAAVGNGADGAEQTSSGGGWWVRGSEYLGRRVRRAVYDEDSAEIVGAADGEIVGWLPLEVSDFVSEFFKKPAALWHMVYDNEAVGEEDLEEFEVRDAIESYNRDAWADLGDGKEEREEVIFFFSVPTSTSNTTATPLPKPALYYFYRLKTMLASTELSADIR